MVNIKEEQFNQNDIVEHDNRHENVQKIKAHLPKLKKVTLLEKCFYTALIITAITLAVSKIYIRNLIESTQTEIGMVQSSIDEKNQKIEDLKQQQNELLRTDRVKEIAEKEGLKTTDNNFRKLD
ncbi:MAG: cell division protein FtsL [Streptococcaceae bacterium]|jgi:cell division protein FtsL|nr:cell division protein FtsL [Streptococcaceae bacterium]